MKKQEFKAGNTVKIGFMTLTVIGMADSREHYRPNAWILEYKGTKYQFTPYYGLEKCK